MDRRVRRGRRAVFPHLQSGAAGKEIRSGRGYVRRWVPELAAAELSCIHAPWEAAPEVLARAGVKLGTTYPRPMVDHRAARAEALAAYEQMKQARG